MKLSIIIAILNSHEVVRRQMLHFKQMDLGPEVEFIFVDDGSEPPLNPDVLLPNFSLIATHDYRPWTQGLARMKAAGIARGEYLFMTDIDHIISRDAIEAALGFKGDKMTFQRRFAYLDEQGKLVRDRQKLIDWGLLQRGIRDEELSDGFHGNTFVMRKAVFDALGGYSLKRCNSGTHLQGEDRDLNHRFRNGARAGRFSPEIVGPPIYFFPIGRYHATGDENPHGLFHNMFREKWG